MERELAVSCASSFTRYYGHVARVLRRARRRVAEHVARVRRRAEGPVRPERAQLHGRQRQRERHVADPVGRGERAAVAVDVDEHVLSTNPRSTLTRQ